MHTLTERRAQSKGVFVLGRPQIISIWLCICVSWSVGDARTGVQLCIL
jgi:hypothetical protein